MDNNKNENSVSRQTFEPVSIMVTKIFSAGVLCSSGVSSVTYHGFGPEQTLGGNDVSFSGFGNEYTL